MKFVVGSDKMGLKIKDACVAMLKEQGHEIEDVGTLSEDKPMPHTLVGAAVAGKIQSKEADLGLLFCGTGLGVSLTANKFKGVYAGVVESVYAARMCRQINNCNVLAMGGYIIGETMAKEMVEAFVNTDFHPGFAPARVELLEGQFKIMQDIENENFK